VRDLERFLYFNALRALSGSGLGLLNCGVQPSKPAKVDLNDGLQAYDRKISNCDGSQSRSEDNP